MKPATVLALVNGDFANAIAASTPGGIEAQEAAGQRSMCAASNLPKEISGCTRADLVAIGFVFGADVDDLFVSATLPEGWALQPTDHSMHTDIVDDQGRKRGSIFYKAAFYDRKADLRMLHRYNLTSYYGCDAAGNAVAFADDPTHRATVVLDGEKPIFTAGIISEAEESKTRWAQSDAHSAAGKAWLNEHFPEWDSVTAYW